jgi:glutathione S-transferase
MILRLFGTTTSPYVRRVRIIAMELQLVVELVEVSTLTGQQRLAEVSPIWKVPALQIVDEPQVILDSHAICELLLRRCGPGDVRPLDPEDMTARNVLTVIDGALDSLINALYLTRDGIDSFHSAYLRKQVDRAENALRWLDARVGDTGFGPGFGLTEIALVAAVDWIRLRSALPLDNHDRLVRAAAHWNARPSVAATAP